MARMRSGTVFPAMLVLLLGGLFFLAQSAPPAADPQPDPSLLAHWRMDEGRGYTASDSSGHNHNGAVTDPNTWTQGRLEGALRFNGAGDGVYVGWKQELRPAQPLTVMAWVNVSSYGAGDPIIAWSMGAGVDGVNDTDGGYGLFVMPGDVEGEGTILFGLRTVGSTQMTYASASGQPTNQWIHVAGAYDGQFQRIYINGALSQSIPATGSIHWSGSGRDYLELGRQRQADGSERYLQGTLDDIRIYDRPLGPAEVGQVGGDLIASSIGRVVTATIKPKIVCWNPDDPAVFTVGFKIGNQQVTPNGEVSQDTLVLFDHSAHGGGRMDEIWFDEKHFVFKDDDIISLSSGFFNLFAFRTFAHAWITRPNPSPPRYCPAAPGIERIRKVQIKGRLRPGIPDVTLYDSIIFWGPLCTIDASAANLKTANAIVLHPRVEGPSVLAVESTTVTGLNLFLNPTLEELLRPTRQLDFTTQDVVVKLSQSDRGKVRVIHEDSMGRQTIVLDAHQTDPMAAVNLVPLLEGGGTFTVEGIEPGLVNLQLSYYVEIQDDQSQKHSATCYANFLITVAQADIDVDTNNNGLLDAQDDPQDDPTKETLPPGKLLGVGGDRQPVSITLDPSPAALLASDPSTPFKVRLRQTGAGKLRVFANRNDAEPRLDADETETVLFSRAGLDPRVGDVLSRVLLGGQATLYMEGATPGEIDLELVYEFGTNPGLVCTDRVKVTVIDVEFTEIKGLYMSDGSYSTGYTSGDNLGRIYSNRIYDPADPGKTIWTRNKQYVDLTATIIPTGLTLPEGMRIVWDVLDPDDPSNEDPVTDPSANPILDPNDYDNKDNDGDGKADNSDSNDNTGSRDGAGFWEQLHVDYALSGNETAVTRGISRLRFNATDDGGDNFDIKARLKITARAQPTAGVKTGVMTVWNLLDVEYVKMADALDLAALANKNANAFLAKAFVELSPTTRDVADFENPPGKKQMGPNELTASDESGKYATKVDGEFTHEGDPGWFFAVAANWFVEPLNEGLAPILYSGPATVVSNVELELPLGTSLSDTDKMATGQKTATLPPDGNNRVMKTNIGITVAGEYKDGTVLYDRDPVTGVFRKRGALAGHTVGMGGGEVITYYAAEDIPNGDIEIRKLKVSAVLIAETDAPFRRAIFHYDDFSWQAATRRFLVLEAEYSTPKVDNALSFGLIDHGLAIGSSPTIMVVGTGALSVSGISPGLDRGRTLVFTKAFSEQDINNEMHISSLIHEFGHGLGFHHICGNWDFKSHGITGTACTMHYNYLWLLNGMLNDPPPPVGTLTVEPFTEGHRGPFFCAPHIMAIRKANLEDNSNLGWRP